MNINDLTLGQAKELANLFNNKQVAGVETISSFIGKKVIVRTQSAGVFFGFLSEKVGKEVILTNARRLWYWKTANDGISLSDMAIGGAHKDSKFCAPVDIWLEAIEIIPCSDTAIKSIEEKSIYKA